MRRRPRLPDERGKPKRSSRFLQRRDPRRLLRQYPLEISRREWPFRRTETNRGVPWNREREAAQERERRATAAAVGPREFSSAGETRRMRTRLQGWEWAEGREEAGMD